MLWQASRFLLYRAPAAALRWSRPFSTYITAETAGVSNFVDKRTESFRSMDPPTTKLSVSLVLADNSILSSKEVDKVIIPTTKGQMDILPGNVATIAELKPGVLSVYEGKDIAKYFLCGGFAFVHSNNIADILAFEATPLDRVNPNMVHERLIESVKMLKSTSIDVKKAIAKIEVDVLSALIAAVAG